MSTCCDGLNLHWEGKGERKVRSKPPIQSLLSQKAEIDGAARAHTGEQSPPRDNHRKRKRSVAGLPAARCRKKPSLRLGTDGDDEGDRGEQPQRYNGDLLFSSFLGFLRPGQSSKVMIPEVASGRNRREFIGFLPNSTLCSDPFPTHSSSVVYPPFLVSKIWTGAKRVRNRRSANQRPSRREFT